MNISTSLTQLIGNTPLLELCSLAKHHATPARLIAKLEYFNPLGSVKDRAAFAIICAAEQQGLLQPGAVVIEPTSGNMGVGLAFVCATRGYRLILTMPESMSIERRMLLSALGAEIVLTPAAGGMSGAVQKAQELHIRHPGSFLPMQFDNPANPQAHRDTTAQEIWRDTDGQVDLLVAGFGTGGTISGTGEALKALRSDIRVIGVEPASSPLVTQGQSGPHKLQGIGANFIPKNLNTAILDEILPVTDDDALAATRELAKTEGLLVGISSGAAVYAALQLAQRPENHGKNIVIILPDTGERYLSTGVFN